MNFPNSYDQTTTIVPAEKIGNIGMQDAQRLLDQGYEVHYGLTADFADDIAKLALEPAIKEYCPNDSGRRFGDRETTAKWLQKGRGTFLLLKRKEDGALELVGYGWVGAGTNSHAPGGEATFAIRIGEAGQGQGLATPFARLIVFGAAVVYEAKNLWLETWQSNAGAVHVYHKIGFVDVAEEESERTSGNGEKVADTRLFMTLPNDLLPKS